MSYSRDRCGRRGIAAAGRRAGPPSRRRRAGVLENGIREISGEVRNSLDFHRSQEGGGEVSHVVLSGAAQDIPGFAEALQRRSASRCAATRVGVVDAACRARSRRTGWRSPPAWPRGGAAMRAVNLIPPRARAAARVGAGRSGGAAYAVLGAARRPGAARAALRHGPPPGLQPQRRSGDADRAGAARSGRRPPGWRPTRASSRCANSARRPSPQLVDSRFDWAHAFHEFGRVLPATPRSPRSTARSGRPRATAAPSAAASRRSRRRAAPRRLPAPQRRLGDAPRQRPHLHAQRLRDEPAGGRADARAPAPDRRRQRSHAAELDQGQRRRLRRRRRRAAARASDPLRRRRSTFDAAARRLGAATASSDDAKLATSTREQRR